ncbi:MAG: XTP/dITP diphosphatase [Candidatus Odinarchaeia archaeon]
MKLFFATGNKNKVKEAQEILKQFGFEVEHLPIERVELQSDNLEEIASYSALEIANKVNKTVFVEDTGLFIEYLKGFPGPYSSYVYKTIGNEGILKLLRDVENRKAYFESVIAFCKPREKPVCVSARVYGRISKEIRGELWGYDPIFIPDEGNGKTYAEMGIYEKNKISHRRKVLEKFAVWLKKSLNQQR